jgi:hypothetical protein
MSLALVVHVTMKLASDDADSANDAEELLLGDSGWMVPLQLKQKVIPQNNSSPEITAKSFKQQESHHHNKILKSSELKLSKRKQFSTQKISNKLNRFIETEFECNTP